MLDTTALSLAWLRWLVVRKLHTGFSVWLGAPFHDTESEHFVARYIERAPLSLEKLSIQHDIATYTTKDGATHELNALEFLAPLVLGG